jgi:NADH-quinone oxidoreductase subunit J
VTAELVLFWVFSTAIVASALGVIFARNPIASAMSLVACFFFLAGVYVLLWAHTIAALQVLVYTGAIMVLFLFVIMLLSLSDSGPVMQLSPSRILGGLATGGILAGLVMALKKLPEQSLGWTHDPVMALKKLPEQSLGWTHDPARLASYGTIRELGATLYTQWLFPFEAVSLLLLVAILGAVVVAKPRI